MITIEKQNGVLIRSLTEEEYANTFGCAVRHHDDWAEFLVHGEEIPQEWIHPETEQTLNLSNIAPEQIAQMPQESIDALKQRLNL